MSGVARACEALDAALFTTPAFTIDAGNQRVTSHRTVAAARRAVEQDRAASWVATVRPGVVAVDVDLSDDDAAAAVLAVLMTWCDDHTVWSLARRSGGGPGRWHLFAVAGELEPALREAVAQVRSDHQLDGRQVDLRREVRPLSAPHRRTGAAGVPDDVEHAARDLAASWRQPGSGVARSRSGEEIAPRAPLAHPVGGLPARFWEEIARPHEKGADRSRAEFEFTAQMVRAGWSESQAWAVVADPAHAGLARSRQRGRAWWRRYSWNAIEAVDSTPLARRSGVNRTLWEGPYDWSAAVVPAALGLRTVWHRWSSRQRHTIDHVLAVVADRFTRHGVEEPLPLSLRSLVEDTGLALGTCRGALAELVEVGMLYRVDTGTNRDGTTAHVYGLNVDMFVLDAVVDTPSTYAPPPADPLWLASPAGSLSHWLSLHLHPETHAPSRHQSSTGTSWLQERGLLTKSPTPRPRARTHVCRPRDGLRRWKALRERHAHERQTFRARLAEWRRAARERWEQGRERAREKAAARNEMRQRLWWSRLPESERMARSQAWREWWNGLAPYERERRRCALDERRALAARGTALSSR